MDEIFRNMYPDSASFDNATGRGVLSAADGTCGALRNGNGNKTVGEAWRDVMIGSGGEPAMTLEDFLAKAINEEDVRVPAVGGFGMEAAMMSPAPAVHFPAAGCVQNVIGVDFGSGMTAVSGSGGRGRRKAAVEEVQLDKATQQKQRRMIKNRESATRCRERKQAYTVELESMVTQLEEENARLSIEDEVSHQLGFAGSLSQGEKQTANGEHNSGGGEEETSTSSEKNAFPMNDDDA